MNFFLNLLIRCYFPFVGALCMLSFGGTVVLIMVLVENDLWYLGIPAAFLALAGLHMLYVLYFVITFKPDKDFLEMKTPRQQLRSVYELVDRVAEQWDLDAPDEIRLGAGTVAHVYENDKGKRILVIGGIAVAAMSQDTLAGIVAHELAHFTSGDTQLAKRTFSRRLTMEAYHYLCRRYPISYINPLVWFASLYRLTFRIVDAKVSRNQEYAADRYSVKQAGVEAASSALIYVCVTEHLRWANISRMIEIAVKSEQVMVPIFAQQVQEARTTDDKEWKKALNKALMEFTNLFDDHPCLRDRLKAMGIEPKKALRVALEQRGTPTSVLIPGWDRIEKEMSERLMLPYRERRAALLDAYKVIKAVDRAGGNSGF